MLRADGFSPQEMIEKPNKPVDLTGIDLTQYKTIIFGSNNADYTPFGDKSMVKALVNYVFAGGVLAVHQRRQFRIQLRRLRRVRIRISWCDSGST